MVLLALPAASKGVSSEAITPITDGIGAARGSGEKSPDRWHRYISIVAAGS
jgi:hypothetical protein